MTGVQTCALPISVSVALTAGQPAKSVTIRITYPNSCSLKYDEVDLRLREMLVASEIEPKELETELAETETAEPSEA